MISHTALSFARSHVHDDTTRLLLSAARYPDIDMQAAVQQIEGLHTAQQKWPSLLQCDGFVYPPRLNREQASSDETAVHKVYVACELFGGQPPLSVADLTGGMGVDSIAFAQCSRLAIPPCRQVPTCVDYVERSELLCTLMEHNRVALGLDNICVHCGDSMQWLASVERRFDMLFIDPARRSATGRKVSAFEDCTPDILQFMELLRSRCRWLMVKASPMIDIDMACRQLGAVAEVHVVAVVGECKEVLFLCGQSSATEPRIVCCNLSNLSPPSPPSPPRTPSPPSPPSSLSFTRSEEAACTPCYCSAVGRYLYMPDASLMKAGPFNLIARRYGLQKLASNTHLYTSDERVGAFPGRMFEVLHEVKPSRKAVAAAIPDGKAHVVARNYPVAAADLQRQLAIKEGGDMYVVATTIGSRHTAFVCRRTG